MESSETLQRIFWRNRWLLIALIVLPVAVVVPFLKAQPVTYAATAYVQGDSPTPTSDTQIQAVKAQVNAVATNPATAGDAIAASHVNRDAHTVARNSSVASYGSSTVTTVTVADPSKPVAIRLAGALASSVVSQLNRLGSRDNPQLAALSRTYQQLASQRDHLVAQLQAVGTGNSQAQSILTELNAVEQQLLSNQSATQQFLNTASGGAAVLAVPTTATAKSHAVLEYAALLGLLGLVIGLLIGTVREIIRPTVAEPAAAARELGVVLLGDAETTDGKLCGLGDDLATHLDLAAERLGARTLVLTGPIPRAQLAALADRLSGELPAVPAGNGAAHARRPTPDTSLAWKIHASSGTGPGNGVTSPAGPASGVTSPDGPASYSGSAEAGTAISLLPGRAVALPDLRRGALPQDPALVAVLPRFAPRAALDRIRDLGNTTAWPILGVIGLRHQGPERAARRHSAPGPESAAEDAESREPAEKGDAT